MDTSVKYCKALELFLEERLNLAFCIISMRWLLKRLGLIQNGASKVSHENSWLTCNLHPGCISCKRKLRSECLKVIKDEANSRLKLRIRNVPSSSNANPISTCLAVETSAYSNEAIVVLPAISGTLLVELGYVNNENIFITLEYQMIDLGPRVLIQASQQDWFSLDQGEKSIHQKMYELATKHSGQGGSERISS